MRELDYIADAIQMSERAQPGELVCARLVRRRARRLPPLVAASASIGAAFLAAIAIVLPGRGGLVGEQALTGTARNVSIADPPPRSLVLSSIERAQGLSSHSVTALHRPELP
jgi:hypothetical protein